MSAPEPLEIVAHRGTGSDAVPPLEYSSNRPAAPPENTLPAFEWGWRHGTTCELDVRLTSDQRLIVIHDATTGRTCDRDLTVADSSLADLRNLDAGRKKGALWSCLRLPTLEEVFEIMPDGRRLYVELKSGSGINRPLVDAIRASGKRADQLVLISFNLDVIGRLKQLLPDYTCYLVVSFKQHGADGAWTAAYKTPDLSDPRFLKPRKRIIAPEPPRAAGDLHRALIDLVRKPVAGDSVLPLDGLNVTWRQPEGFAAAMRSAGVRWGCWTVDTADTARLMRSRGAVQITSNCPDDIRDALSHTAGSG